MSSFNDETRYFLQGDDVFAVNASGKHTQISVFPTTHNPQSTP